MGKKGSSFMLASSKRQCYSDDNDKYNIFICIVIVIVITHIKHIPSPRT
jgi:hypothetical protein